MIDAFFEEVAVMVRNSIADRFHFDPPLLVGVLLMSALGLMVLYSASEQSFDTILHQGLRLMVGLVAMIIVAQFLLQDCSLGSYIISHCLISIGDCPVFGAGRGVQRWLDLGFSGFNHRNYENCCALTVASLVSNKLLPPDLKTIAIAGVLIFLPTVLIAMQPG